MVLFASEHYFQWESTLSLMCSHTLKSCANPISLHLQAFGYLLMLTKHALQRTEAEKETIYGDPHLKLNIEIHSMAYDICGSVVPGIEQGKNRISEY